MSYSPVKPLSAFGLCFYDEDCADEHGAGWTCEWGGCEPPPGEIVGPMQNGNGNGNGDDWSYNECEIDADCGSGKKCQHNMIMPNECVPHVEPSLGPCIKQADCGVGYSCINGQCLIDLAGPCLEDAHCGANLYCDEGVCKRKIAAKTCTTMLDCDDPAMRCVAGVCREPECRTDADCNWDPALPKCGGDFRCEPPPYVPPPPPPPQCPPNMVGRPPQCYPKDQPPPPPPPPIAEQPVKDYGWLAWTMAAVTVGGLGLAYMAKSKKDKEKKKV